ncbi:MAG: DUF92 domain-containing protein [Bacteroidetes bacterium]|nr:MAG: DUF92 domain-containing protein [Bacteroidota bacterium]
MASITFFTPNLRGMKVEAVALMLLAIASTLVLSNWLAQKKWLPLPIARKVLHIVGVGACTVALEFFTNVRLLQVLVAGFVILLLCAVHFNWIGLNRGPRKSWGIALFPLAYFILLLAFAPLQPWLIVYPMAILTLADAAAAVSGEVWARHFFHISADRKSWLGSTCFAAVSFLILGFLPFCGISALQMPVVAEYGLVPWLGISACMALVLAAAEASCSKGWDNFIVPLLAAWLLHMALLPAANVLLQLPVGIILSVAVAWLAHGRKWLSTDGAVVAALLGVVVWLAGGWLMAAPLVAFFVLGSLLGKLPAKAALATDEKHQKPRDWQQVLCNGGVAGLCAVGWGLTGGEQYLLAVYASMAVCLADTCASEVGMRYGGRPMDILRIKPLPVGVSGGISWIGSLGGLLGAAVMALLAFGMAPYLSHSLGVLVLAGVAGMLLDSLLGSAYQAQYNAAGQPSDVPQKNLPAVLQKGRAWVTNDLVNLLSNIVVTAGVVYFALR